MSGNIEYYCECAEYQHEYAVEVALVWHAYFRGIPLPQIPWKFCPYCGKPMQERVVDNQYVTKPRRSG